MHRTRKYSAAVWAAVSVIALIGFAVRSNVSQTSTRTASASAPFGSVPQDAALAAIGDGILVVTGGTGSDGQLSDRIAIYDSASGTWRRAGLMTVARAGHTATALADGRVLIIGGRTPNGPTSSAELYNPATGVSVTVSAADASAISASVQPK